ncbi:MAG: phosphoribosylamine--glycine ligase [Candidatus Yanofskybacteria bacterium]|nr:phosphoribosylamine--glycine ligase [Candidatus Yanofskybacteria bacterium]
MMKRGVHGKAGKKVLIEEYLSGREISIHAFCDGEHATLFPAAKDHKRIFDGDKGPNTGGMGTIVPVSAVNNRDKKEIEQKIIIPTLSALKKRGYPFVGILYPGIMITKDGPKVIEFNARFGDPEAQSYMRILETDLLDILLASVRGKLKDVNVHWNNNYACCVVCASDGYPGNYISGKTISGLDKISNKDIVLFHAGTKIQDSHILTNGGRVFGITATGRTLNQALSKAYGATKIISFPGMFFRKDIGK